MRLLEILQFPGNARKYHGVYSRIGTVTVIHVLYLVIYVVLLPYHGKGVGALIAIVIAACGWFFGARAGLLIGLFLYPMSNLLLTILFQTSLYFDLFEPVSFMFALVGGLVGVTIGHLSTLTVNLQKEIEQREVIEEKLVRQKSELSDFAHEMSHDLRNSLTVVHAYARLLTKKYDLSMILKIIERSKSMQKLLDKSVVLADAGLAMDKSGEVSLDTVLDRAAEVTVKPRSIAFSRDALPVVRADEEKTFQVFQNLLDNAVKHGNPSNIEVRAMKEANNHIITVSNDGLPVSSVTRLKLFNETGKRARTPGLGLKIVKKITDAHGWDICLDDDPEMTVFRITIPTD